MSKDDHSRNDEEYKGEAEKVVAAAQDDEASLSSSSTCSGNTREFQLLDSEKDNTRNQLETNEPCINIENCNIVNEKNKDDNSKRDKKTKQQQQQQPNKDDLSSSDIPIPTELTRSTMVSLPGAFAQPGINDSSTSSTSRSCQDDDGNDMHNHCHNNDSSSFWSSLVDRNRSVPEPPLLTATLVQDEDEDDQHGKEPTARATRIASSIVAHAEPMEEHNARMGGNGHDDDDDDSDSSSSPSLLNKGGGGGVPCCGCRIYWWQVFLVAASLVALALGVALAVINTKSDDGKKKESRGPPPPYRPTSSFHVVSWGSLMQDCDDYDATTDTFSTAPSTLTVECSGKDTTAYVLAAISVNTTTQVNCTRQGPTTFSCQQQQQQQQHDESDSLRTATFRETTAAAAGILVQCYHEEKDNRHRRLSGSKIGQYVPRLEALLSPSKASNCTALHRKHDSRVLQPSSSDDDGISGGGLGQWMSVGRVCWDPKKTEVHLLDFFPCQQDSATRWFNGKIDEDSNGIPSPPQSYCLDAVTCLDNKEWLSAFPPDDTCLLSRTMPLEMKSGGADMAEDCHVHHNDSSPDILPDYWELDALQGRLEEWLQSHEDPVDQLIRIIRNSWDEYIENSNGTVSN